MNLFIRSATGIPYYVRQIEKHTLHKCDALAILYSNTPFRFTRQFFFLSLAVDRHVFFFKTFFGPKERIVVVVVLARVKSLLTFFILILKMGFETLLPQKSISTNRLWNVRVCMCVCACACACVLCFRYRSHFENLLASANMNNSKHVLDQWFDCSGGYNWKEI